MDKVNIKTYKILFEGKQFQKAKRFIKKKINGGFTSPEIFFYLADCDYELGNYKKAIESYTVAIKTKKKIVFKSNAYYNRALCKVELKQYNAAITDFIKAQTLGENAEYDIARMYILLDNYSIAQKYMTKWISSRPNDAKGWTYNGIILNHFDKHEESLASFYKAFKLGEKDEYVVDAIITELNWLDNINDMISFVLVNKHLLTKRLSEKVINIFEDYDSSGGMVPIKIKERFLSEFVRLESTPTQSTNKEEDGQKIK